MGKTLQAVSLIVTHPRDGQILGPDSAPAQVAAPVEVAAPKMKLKMPSGLLKSLQPANEGAAQRNPAAEEAQPQTGAHAAPAGDAALEVGEAAAEPPSMRRTKKAATEGASTPSSAQKENKPGDNDAGKAQQEGSVSPEAKTGKKGKGKAKGKKKIDPLVAAMQQAKQCYAEPEAQGTDGFCGATLVVCPVVAAMQWQQEIIRYTGAGMCLVLLLKPMYLVCFLAGWCLCRKLL